MKKICLLNSILFCCLHICFSQPGQLNPSFGENGIVKTDVGANLLYKYNSLGKQVLLQSDGSMYIIISVSDKTYIGKRHPDGTPDLSYGNNSFSISAKISPSKAAFQADGKIVIAGFTSPASINDRYHFAIVRYNRDGSLDKSFSGDGIQITNFANSDEFATAIAVQTNGKIIVTGSTDDGSNSGNNDMALARYNIDGSLDSTFDGDGKLISHLTFPFINSDGTIENDSDFPTAIAIQSDGKIVIAGSVDLLHTYPAPTRVIAIARYNNDGSEDNTLGYQGRKTIYYYSEANDLLVQPDGKLILTGHSAADLVIIRLNPDGNFDYTFSNTGIVITNINGVDYGASVALQPDNKIVVGAASNYYNNSPSDFILLRYNTNGTFDSTFDNDGIKITDINVYDYASSIAIQADGKILAAGYSSDGNNSAGTNYYFSLTRYNLDGSADNTFDGDGILSGQVQFNLGSTIYKCIASQPNGKLIAAGSAWNGSNYDFAIARYNMDGSLDNTFSSDGKQMTGFGTGFSNDTATSIVIQSDGKIILAGKTYNTVTGNEDFALARLNTDGSLDNSFSDDGILTSNFNGNDNVNSVALQNDGKIVVAGSINSNFAVVRYNADGTLDNSFFGSGIQMTTFFPADPNYSANAKSVAIQSNGKIVVAGTASFTLSSPFTYISSDFVIARYNKDGSLDNSFSGDGKQTTDFTNNSLFNVEDIANAVAIQNDGKILIAGKTLTGLPFEFAFARYNTNGNLDSTFDEDGKQISQFKGETQEDGEANSVYIKSDGKIIAGGVKKHVYGISNSRDDFALVFLNPDGSFDSAYDYDGQDTTDFGGSEGINGITVINNKLYAAGYGVYEGNTGVVASYLLDNPQTFTCPSSKVVSTDKGKCFTTVNDIDPLLEDNNTQVNYTLNGATTGSGSGSVSGKTFNKGVTTITYFLANDSSTNCSFTITVKDTTPPHISPIFAFPNFLWPANNTMRYVYLFYNRTDNCGSADCKISVTGNQDITGDWQIINDHLIKLRAENTGEKARIYTITVTCTDASGNTASRNVNIRVSNFRGRDIYVNSGSDANRPYESVLDDFNLKVFPNPSKYRFNLQLQGNNTNEKVDVNVYDISGRLMETKTGLISGKNIILGSSLKQGTYIMEVHQGIDVND